MIDPKCWDGKVYAAEVVSSTRAPIDDLLPMFSVANRMPWSISVLKRRYPIGGLIVEAANDQFNCFNIAFDADDTTAQKTIEGFAVSVHECGHMMDGNHTRYMLRPDLEYTCSSTPIRTSPKRSMIVGDEFEAGWPADFESFSLRTIYLLPPPPGMAGNAGDQNFPLLFTEYSQYVNSLATNYNFADFRDDGGYREAAQAFSWYIERYLHKMRLMYKTEYDKLLNDMCWRQLVLAVWGRAQRYLDVTRGMRGFTHTDDALLASLTNTPVLLDEIERLRVADGCPR